MKREDWEIDGEKYISIRLQQPDIARDEECLHLDWEIADNGHAYCLVNRCGKDITDLMPDEADRADQAVKDYLADKADREDYCD